MKKQSESSAKAKTSKKKDSDARSNAGKTVTTQISTEAHEVLKKITADRHTSVNTLLRSYIEEALTQEIQGEAQADVPDLSPAELEPLQEDANEGYHYFVGNYGIRFERIAIGSNFFTGVYFANFWPAVVFNLVGMPLGWILLPGLAGSAVSPFISIIWAVCRDVFGSIRRDGSHKIAAWGILAGTASGITVVMALYSAFIDRPRFGIPSLLTLLAGIIVIGLLVNVPVEVNNHLNQRRAKKISKYAGEWGEDICQAIVNHEIVPEMTKEMVLLSWGEPTVIENMEATKDYTTEKWIFKSKPKTMYVWFTDGFVNKINDSGK